MRSIPPSAQERSRLPAERSAQLSPSFSAANMQSNLAWGAGGSEERLDLHEIWRKLWRGRFLIALITIVGTVLGVVVIKQLTPTYTASSTIMLETRQRQVFESEAVVPGLVVDEEVIQGEVEVLYSRELARRVAVDLNLMDDPEFNGELAEEEDTEGWLTVAKAWASDVEAKIRDVVGQPVEEEPELSASEAEAQRQKEVVDTLLDGLSVSQVGEAPVIRVSYTSDNAKTAARLANDISWSYISNQLELKSSETRLARQWLQERIGSLRAEVQEKERQIEKLRSEAGILRGADTDVSVATQQMSELASQRIAAIMERQRAESQLDRNTQGEFLASPVVQGLLLKEEELSRELQQKSVEFGPNHPEILNLNESLSGIENSLAIERQRIVNKLQADVDSARQREAQLDQSLEELSAKVEATNEQQVEIRALEREVEAKRTLLENFLARLQETAQQEEIQQPDARVLSLAEVPELPSFPKTKLFALMAFCGSAFVGVAIAYVFESLDRSFQTAGQIRSGLGMQVLQLVPRVRRRFGPVRPVDVVVDEPNSSFSEALRSLYVTLLPPRNTPKVILFSSSLPGEGKTSLTLAFGRFLAQAGRSVIVVDCDLRKSSVHRTLDGEPYPGLVDHLLGNVPINDTIQADTRTSLHYVASGSYPDNPVDLLSSQAMYSAISRLGRTYDVVLLDSAPVLAVAETRVLQQFVDKAVFVIRWGHTPQAAATEAIRVLEDSSFRFSFAGVVFNAVDLKTYAHYDEGLYYTSVKSYYRE